MREISKLDDLLDFVNKNKNSEMYLEIDEKCIGCEDVVLGKVAEGTYRLMSKERCDKKGESSLFSSYSIPTEKSVDIKYAIYYYGITTGKNKKFYLD